MKKVSVIIPNYNGQELLVENLPTVIGAMNNPENGIIEIILVDDASIDKSVPVVKNKFPEITVIKHKINRGFAASVDTGVRMAKAGLVCLLNTDVKVSEDFLVKTLPYFNNNKVFGVSLHEKGYGWAKGFFKEGYIVHSPGEEDSVSHETFWVNGGSGVFSREHWMELGGMDEKNLSPYYWEDLDLSYRAMKRGYKLYWEPFSFVYHDHAKTIEKINPRVRNRIWERNQLRVIWKNLTSKTLFRKHLLGLISRTIKHPGYFLVVVSALAAAPAILKARKVEMREGKISDEAIFAKFR